MKKISYILGLLLFLSCSEMVDDCLDSYGSEVSKIIKVESFDKLLIHEGVSLTIIQSETQKVELITGSNLVNDVDFEVVDKRLIIKDHNSCDWVRGYIPVQVNVYVPNLTEVRSSTQYDVRSEGVLEFSSLRLISEDFYDNALNNTGDFKLSIQSSSLHTTSNGLTNFIISGQVDYLNVFVASGNSRFEGGDLLAKEIEFYHRGTNDLIFYPVNKLSGNLYSTGDVILKNKPSTIDVTAHYKGSLVLP